MRLVRRRWSSSAAAAAEPYRAPWAQGRPEEGIRLLRERIAMEPKRRELRLELADMLMGVGAFGEVVAVADEALRETGTGADRARVLFQRGDARERLGDVAGAEADYSECLAQGRREAAVLRRLGLLQRSVPLLDEALSKTDGPEGRAEVLYERGKLRAGAGDSDGAMEDFEAAIALHDGCAPAHFGRGDVLLRRGAHLEALQCYDRFWELHKAFYAQRSSGNRLDQSSFSDEALMEVLVKKAACCGGLDMWDTAAQYCDMAREVGVPGRLMALACYYRARAHDAEGDADSALRLLQESLGWGELGAARLLREELLARKGESRD